MLGKTIFSEDENRKIPAELIYNVDETGFTICQKVHRVVARKGKKAVGISSAKKERRFPLCAVCRHQDPSYHRC